MQLHEILVPIDFSRHSEEALTTAIELAKLTGGRLHLLHCYELRPGLTSPYDVVLPPDLEGEIRASAEAQLREWSEKAVAESVEVSWSAIPISPRDGIAEQARAVDADLIVMGTRGLTGLKHAFLGSVAERTVRVAPCPVLTLKHG